MRLIIYFILSWTVSYSQTTTELTLEECYQKAEQNFPLIQQKAILEKSAVLIQENWNSAYWPRLSLNGQLTNQSDVTSLPFALPGAQSPDIPKTQYRVYAEINQSLTGLYTTSLQSDLSEIKSKIDVQKVQIELNSVKDRVLDLYFGILQTDARLKLTEIVIKDLNTTFEKLTSLLNNGMATQSNIDILSAEILTFKQRIIELKSVRDQMAQMLSLFIHEPINETTILINPDDIKQIPTNRRLELDLFKTQRSLFQAQEDLIFAKNIPQVQVFFQTGFGKPALNMLNSEQDSYYIGGIRLMWNLSEFYTYGNDIEQIELNSKSIQVQESLFKFNQSIDQTREEIEQQKYNDLIKSDQAIVTLREKVQLNAKSQLEAGTITANEYSTFVNAVDQARQNLQLHIIQRKMVMYASRLTSGN